jgi:hypothetical protein
MLARTAPGERRFLVPIFAVAPIEPVGLDELLLTDADRFGPSHSPTAAGEPLELNDILEAIGPESRVVRLFDSAAMPTPRELMDRIGGHLEVSAPPAAPPDASQALYDALAELRQSLN